MRALLARFSDQPWLWAITRRGVSRAVFIGFFACFLPLPGQMLIAAIACVYFRANLPIAITLVWVSNPLTLIPIMYSAYLLGTFILGVPIDVHLSIHSGIDWIWNDFSKYWQPLLVGSLVSSLVTASLGYFVIQILWTWSIRKRWQNRTKHHLEH